MSDDAVAAADTLWSNNENDNGRSSSFHKSIFDPVHFSTMLVTILLVFVLYLLLPRGIRKQYCGAYPKRHAWSARSRNSIQQQQSQGQAQQRGGGVETGGYYSGGGRGGDGSSMYTANSTLATNLAAAPGTTATSQQQAPYMSAQQQQQQRGGGNLTPGTTGGGSTAGTTTTTTPHQQDDIVVSAAMQQLRDPGVLIVAHGSRGKPKTVRLSLTETAITWRTESRKAAAAAAAAAQRGGAAAAVVPSALPKLGKLHAVPLSHIMYVDVGKQTTALRRVENAAVPETLCFSLLTKEGSLDLEAATPRERDALVACFSLVLDEVHAQNWRDIYRGPSSDLPSSFDEMDPANLQHQQQQQLQQLGGGGRPM